MPRKRRAYRKSNTGLIVGLSISGGVIVFTLAVIAIFMLGKSKDRSENGDAIAGSVRLLGIPNPRVTEANYDALADGMTPVEVEAILGPGRHPTAGDFDAMFGEKIPELDRMPLHQAREGWERNAERGLVLLWTNDPYFLMVTYTRPPDQEGRLVLKLIRRPDRSFGMMQGVGVRRMAELGSTSNPPSPNAQPPNNALPPATNAPTGTLTVNHLLAEFAMDRTAATKKYRGKRLKLTGQIDSVLVNVVRFKAIGPKFQAQLNGVGTGQIGRYKPGDTITVTGLLKVYTTQGGKFVLDDCMLGN